MCFFLNTKVLGLLMSIVCYRDGVPSCDCIATEVPKDGTTARSADNDKVDGSRPSVADSPAPNTSDSDDDLPGEEETAAKTSSKSPEEKLVKVMSLSRYIHFILLLRHETKKNTLPRVGELSNVVDERVAVYRAMTGLRVASAS